MCFGSHRWGKSVTRAIRWLAEALQAQVYLKHFFHRLERCWASLEVQRSSADMDSHFLSDFHGTQGDHDTCRQNLLFISKEGNCDKFFPWFVLLLLVSDAFLQNALGENIFFVHHHYAVFFCSNKFSGIIVSLVSVRFMQWSNTLKELIKLLTKGTDLSVPHRKPTQIYNSYCEILF